MQIHSLAAPSVGAAIGTICNSRQDAETLLSDRQVNGDAFDGEHVVEGVIPCIHMNGTSRETLCEQLEQAATAVFNAMEVVNQAAPNSRDYYPQGYAAVRLATEQHDSRMSRLNSVYTELQGIWEALSK